MARFVTVHLCLRYPKSALLAVGRSTGRTVYLLRPHSVFAYNDQCRSPVARLEGPVQGPGCGVQGLGCMGRGAGGGVQGAGLQAGWSAGAGVHGAGV